MISPAELPPYAAHFPNSWQNCPEAQQIDPQLTSFSATLQGTPVTTGACTVAKEVTTTVCWVGAGVA